MELHTRPSSLREKVVGNTSIRVAGQALTQALNLAGLALLARMLVPDDFGLLSMTVLVTAALGTVGDLGLGASIVQRKERAHHTLSSLFWLVLVVGLAMGILAYSCAPVAALLFKEPRVANILRWSALNFPLIAIAVVPSALLTSSMQFGRLETLRLVATCAGLLSATIMALMGYGVMALVAQAIIRNAVSATLLLAFVRFVPSIRFRISEIRSQIRFGLWVFLFEALAYLRNSLDSLLLAMTTTPAILGLYTIARRLATVPARRFVGALTSVTFPAFAAIKEDSARLACAHLQSSTFASNILLSSLLPMAAISQHILRVVVGEPWVAASGALSILCVGSALSGAAWPSGSLFLAKGLSRLRFFLALFATAVLIGCLFAFNPSLRGVALAVAVSEVLACLVSVAFSLRVTGLAFSSLMAYLPGVIGGGVLSGFILATDRMLSSHTLAGTAKTQLAHSLVMIIITTISVALYFCFAPLKDFVRVRKDAFRLFGRVWHWLFKRREQGQGAPLERLPAGTSIVDLEGEHRARYLRAATILRDKSNATVLDCACGTGYGTQIIDMLAKTLDVIGVDLSLEALEHASHELQLEAKPFVRADCRTLPFANASFDAVVSFETLEHIEAPNLAVSEFARLLRPDGLLIVSVPNATVEDMQLNPYHVSSLDEKCLRELLDNDFHIDSILGQCFSRNRHSTRKEGTTGNLDDASEGTLRSLVRTVLKKLPVPLKDIYSWLLHGRPFYPTENDFTFEREATHCAPVLFVQARRKGQAQTR